MMTRREPFDLEAARGRGSFAAWLSGIGMASVGRRCVGRLLR